MSADAARIRGIESLHKPVSELARLFGDSVTFPVFEKRLERHVGLLEKSCLLHPALDLLEEVVRPLLELPVEQGPVRAFGIERRLARLVQQVERLRNLPVDELGTELNGGRSVDLAAGPDAPPDAVASLED